MALKPLTPLQDRFCREYVVDLSATHAYKRAGGSTKSANRNGYTLLQMPHIAARIAELQKKIATKLEVNAERVLDELAKVAFANFGEYVTPSGEVDISKLTSRQWAAIQDYTVDMTGGSGDGERRAVQRVRFKLADKLHALEMLGRHMKLFTDKVELLGDESFVKVLEAARGRVKP